MAIAGEVTPARMDEDWARTAEPFATAAVTSGGLVAGVMLTATMEIGGALARATAEATARRTTLEAARRARRRRPPGDGESPLLAATPAAAAPPTTAPEVLVAVADAAAPPTGFVASMTGAPLERFSALSTIA